MQTAIQRPGNWLDGQIELVRLTRLRRDIRRFLHTASAIYDHDPCWVAPLQVDALRLFSEQNPFFQHAEMALWVACRRGRDVGRIAGIIDWAQNGHAHEGAAYFGFFESTDDRQVSHQLFQAVASWAGAMGLRQLLGPMNPSPNHECGLLVHGFERPPVLMMPYNPRYYEALIREEGFTPAKDLLAFRIDLARCPLARVERVLERFRRRHPEVRIRPVRRGQLRCDVPRIKEVYNQAWSRNWGFTPMTDAEVDFMAQRLAPLLREGLVWLAETRDEPVGILIALPDFNEIIHPLRGRLLTPRLLRLILFWAGRRQPALARVVALGVKERFRGRGIESVMLAEALRVGTQIGYVAAEASWVLEDNLKSQRIISSFGGRQYKTYRLFRRPL